MLRQLEAFAKFLRVTLLNHPPMRTARRSGHEEREEIIGGKEEQE